MTTKLSFSELLERSKSESIAVHTPTEEQAIALLNELDKKGYRWASGRNLTDNTRYENYKENTCYIFGISSHSSEVVMYGLLNWYQYDGYTIIDFSEIDFEEKKQ